MPQITLEYTSNITQEFKFDFIFSEIHRIVSKTGGINIKNCKSRANKQQNYFIGQGESNNAFIHLEIRFLEGRSDLLKQDIGNKVLIFLKDYFKSSLTGFDLQITVEITDIQKKTYFKTPEDSFIKG